MGGRIPESIIQEVRQAADIVEIVSEVVVLRQAGKNLVGLCPFHSEKTPSFTVSPDKQIFHCFGCGEGGSVFAFLMRHEGLNFPETVRRLARRYGIRIPEAAQSPGEARRRDQRAQLLAVNQEAAAFFRAMRVHPEQGRPARAYLARRSLPPELVNAFDLGYAPEGWDLLLRHLTGRRFAPALIEAAGLAVPRKSGRGHYDRFRGRVIFPIHDLDGRVVGFGGRVLDDALPKYLNSPETPLFNKRRCLYGLNQARDRIRETGTVYIVEGYTDLLALHQYGIQNAAATLGTALTSEQVGLLKRFVGQGRIVLVFDGDAAGQKAVERTRPIFEQMHARFTAGSYQRESGVNTLILALPAGHDPDSFLRAEGPEAFARLAAGAQGMVSFLIDAALRQHGDSLEGRARAVGELAGALRAVGDPVTRALYVRLLAERVGVDEAVIVQRMRQVAASTAKPNRRSAPAAGRPERAPAPPPLERQLTAMLLQYPPALEAVDKRNLTSYFRDQRLRTIAETALARFRASGRVDGLLEALEDPALQRIASALSISDEPWTPEGCRRVIGRFELARRPGDGDLCDQIAAAEQQADVERWERLLRERQQAARNKERSKRELMNR